MDIEIKVIEHTITTSSCDVQVGNVGLTFARTPKGIRKVASARWERPATYITNWAFYEARRQATNAITSKYNEVRFTCRKKEFIVDEEKVKLVLERNKKRGQKYSTLLKPHEQIEAWLVSIGRWTLEREKKAFSILGQMGSREAAKTRVARKKRELAAAEAARQGSLDLSGNDQ